MDNSTPQTVQHLAPQLNKPDDHEDTSTGAGAQRPTGRHFDLRSSVVYVSFVALFVIFSITLRGDGFLTRTNLSNVVLQAATIAIMASVYVLVLSAGEIDLSIGAVVALSALVTASVLQSHGFVLG